MALGLLMLAGLWMFIINTADNFRVVGSRLLRYGETWYEKFLIYPGDIFVPTSPIV